jgi:EAL domain-containing protein (putative c-di-GMP-specific phosphodiesterase class I)
LRWQRPGHGLVGPSEFLARAEENGLIIPINEWALREACRQAKLWQQRGHPPTRVGVNLSSIQFFKQNVPLMVTKVLAETGLDPWLLDLELTESIVMHNTEAVSKDLQQLRELGVGISIDDFGTRYSTLAYVKHFPVDRLKSTSASCATSRPNPSDAAIVRADREPRAQPGPRDRRRGRRDGAASNDAACRKAATRFRAFISVDR